MKLVSGCTLRSLKIVLQCKVPVNGGQASDDYTGNFFGMSVFVPNFPKIDVDEIQFRSVMSQRGELELYRR